VAAVAGALRVQVPALRLPEAPQVSARQDEARLGEALVQPPQVVLPRAQAPGQVLLREAGLPVARLAQQAVLQGRDRSPTAAR
jgi:hypothetical protein